MIAGTQLHEANDVPETGGSARRKTALEQASCTPTTSLWDSRMGCTSTTSHGTVSWAAHPPPHSRIFLWAATSPEFIFPQKL